MSKNIFTAEQLKDDLLTLRTEGYKKGAWTGFGRLFNNYSMKLGSSTYVYAAPHQGKSQFGFELMMNTAEFSGWRWAIFSPETGSPTQVFSELLWVYLRKPFLVNDKLTATDEEVASAIEFINNHFFIIDAGLNDITVKGIIQEALNIEEKVGKIQGLFIDPYTEVANDVNAGVRDDVAIASDLSNIRKHTVDNNWHTLLTIHTRGLAVKYSGDVAYLPKPTMSDIAGGQMWSRKGFMIINIWRCPFGLTDANGRPYEKNEVEISIQKAKPKAMGKLGTVTMYYDVLKNRYYTKDEMGNPEFAYQNPEYDPTTNDVVQATAPPKKKELPTPEQSELIF